MPTERRIGCCCRNQRLLFIAGPLLRGKEFSISQKLPDGWCNAGVRATNNRADIFAAVRLLEQTQLLPCWRSSTVCVDSENVYNCKSRWIRNTTSDNKGALQSQPLGARTGTNQNATEKNLLTFVWILTDPENLLCGTTFLVSFVANVLGRL